MLSKARYEWEYSDEFTRLGILKFMKMPVELLNTEFDKIPNHYQRRLSVFVESELDYKDDWKELREVEA